MCMSSVAKIIKVIGISEKGWEDAAQIAITEAKKIVRFNFSKKDETLHEAGRRLLKLL